MDFGLFLRAARDSHIFVFLMGVGCALLGIVTAWLLFINTPLAGSIGVMSVFFTSLALFPSWDKILSIKAIMVGTERRVIRGGGAEFTELRLAGADEKINPWRVIRNHGNLFQAYVLSFMGIFAVYAILQILLPGAVAQGLFNQQTSILSVRATGLGDVWGIISNNLGVFLVCFLISLAYRSGIFIIAWNASVWGVVFGNFLRQGIAAQQASPVFFALVVTAAVMPHLVIEALAYLSAAISGALTFKAFWKHPDGGGFGYLLGDAMVVLGFACILLVIGALLEVYFAFPLVRAIM